MKNQNFLITCGAAALAAITLGASGEALLSPRAAGNQVKITPSITATLQPMSQNQSHAVSPRSVGNQMGVANGMANDFNPSFHCRNMQGSPRTVQACTDHPAAMPGCQPVRR